MADIKVQGFDPIMQMQQLQKAAKNGEGDFGDLMEQAAGVLEAAKLARGAGDAPAGLAGNGRGGTETDIMQIGAAQKQSPVRDQATKPKQENKQKISQDDSQNNARVTDDNAKTGKDLQEAADDAGRKIISEVAEKLDIDEADVELAMETLGLSAMELLDPANLTALLTELSGESDPMVLVTDAELYQTFQELMETAKEIGMEAGISPEDVQRLVTDEAPVTAQKAETFAQTFNAAAEEAPVQVHTTQTDAEGNAVDVQVTMENGNVVAEHVNQEAPEHGQDEDRGNRGRHQEIDHREMAEHVVNEIAGHMAEQQVEFNDVLPQEQVTGTDTQQMVEIVRQITEQIRVTITPDVTSMELTLHPASLGNVQLTVAQDAQGRLVAQFAVESETVRQAIESQVAQLQQRLDAQGTRIEAIEITLASHGFESSLNGQQSGEQADEQREAQMRASGPRGTRRIDLTDLDPEEEQTEEERIAAEMMAANGNTVDYTA
ncbi:MAG: flagellar hook-length control protein FliK [Lachnospiraceae bacterium]|nr:flagellar hook-length control protein FliK [Lachnospiraceae bacterium]